MKIKSVLKDAYKGIDKGLLFVTIFMFGFGLLNIVTSSSREAVLVNKASVYYYFYRQVIILGISLIASIVAFWCPTKKYKKWWLLLYVVALGLCVYCFTQSAKRGAQNWIVIGGFQFQPSELAKPVIIISISVLFEKWYMRLKNPALINEHYSIIGILLFVGFLIPFLIFLQKDLGTAMIISGIVGTMFLFSPILFKEKQRIIRLLIILVIAVGLLFKLTSGNRSILSDAQKARFDFFNPCSKYTTGGYQVCNAYIAFNDGGLFGLGIGKSKQKYSYIPEPHTDSIFAIIGEEWGVIESLAFVFLPYAFILYRIMEISSKASTIRGRYITLGVGVGIFLHILINLGGLLGVMPLTGVPLPFLSYGGTYTMCLMISLALVERVAYETKTKKIKV
ncbi:MAG: FtsW/RodA/SpoVE family cell cycle protein [Bacilli bacterium]|nr:FtsW/RodA/SpoVE family cell cycle protein [Bacilli bacterium]